VCSSYSELHQKRKQSKQVHKRHHSVKQADHTSKKSSNNSHYKKKGKNSKIRELSSFTAHNNPHNHMSPANWKFDYKTPAWDQLIVKTGDVGCDLKDGHYRKRSKIRDMQRNDNNMGLGGVFYDCLFDDVKSAFTFIHVLICINNHHLLLFLFM
jgi:hypothetical protein